MYIAVFNFAKVGEARFNFGKVRLSQRATLPKLVQPVLTLAKFLYRSMQLCQSWYSVF